MSDRKLPTKRNPHLGPIEDDEIREDLISKRRLGQTELSVDPGQVGTSNATKPKNLGTFDYAHLRVPLPKDLKGSGIFHASRHHATPEAYFLMRRSSDGYISATGMFKSAFPWASQAEETQEKEYIKSIDSAGNEEIAGNVWLPPTDALTLADEYNMRDWVLVLLDPSPMPKGTSDPNKEVKSPPIFKLPAKEKAKKVTPVPEPEPETEAEDEPRGIAVEELEVNEEASPAVVESKSSRKRSLRSASPSKAAAPPPTTPGRKIATPRRAKRGRPTAASMLAPPPEEDEEPARGHSPKKGGSAAETDEETVKVAIEKIEDETSVTTHVTVETPGTHPDLSLPDDAKAYMDQAHRAILEANKLTASRAALGGRKRKAREMEAEDAEISALTGGDSSLDNQEAQAAEEMEIRPAKRVRATEMELRKEKIKTRALTGVAASLAIGAIVPIIMGTFFQAL